MSRIDVVKTEVFKFDELTEEAQGTAIEKLYDINVDHDWYDCTFEDAKKIAAFMGIEIDKIWFSGFSSQGDGACFEGSYSYRKGSVKAVKDYAPLDKTLHQVVSDLLEIQKPRFYRVRADVKQFGQYYHENCTNVDVYEHDCGYTSISIDEAITKTLRDFMKWIYKQLEKEYEYQTSKKAITETIKANDYEFTEDGKLY